MTKRLIAFISVLVLMCGMFSAMCFSDETDPPVPIEPDDPFIDLAYYNCGIEIDSNGKAYAHTAAMTATTTYQIYLSVSIQYYKNGYWQHYAGSWSGSGTSYAGVGKYYYVVPGYYYRAASAVTVRDADGNYIESASLNSNYTYY